MGGSSEVSLAIQDNVAGPASSALNGDFGPAFVLKARGLFAPPPQHKLPFFGEEFVQAKGIEFARRFDTVEVNVVEGDIGAAEFVDQGERRACDVIASGCIEAFSDAFDQRRLPCSEIAAQDDHALALQ